MDLHLVSRRESVGFATTNLCVVFQLLAVTSECFLGLFLLGNRESVWR